MSRILSILYGLYFIATAAMLFVLQIMLYPIVTLLDPNRKIFHQLTSLWGLHFIKLNPGWAYTIEGSEQIRDEQNYVIVANHQSIADVFLLSTLWRHHFKWVAKDSLWKVPFFGWNMSLIGYVPIKRGNLSSIKEMMQGCRTWLRRGVSIMMFPEGTRSETGNIGAFRDGCFRLALENNVPVLPVVVCGTRELIPKSSNSLNFHGNMHVKVLPPILPEAFGNNARLMKEHVHSTMTAALEQLVAKTEDSPKVCPIKPSAYGIPSHGA
jgi:1-acyl-sn-glycerol-3-phosphate acyltransferase